MNTATLNQPALFTLTDDQRAALAAFHTFLVDPLQTVFVLQGYSGCGKSTLVRTMLDGLDKFFKTVKLIDPKYKPYTVALTATTHKAKENLYQISGYETETIHGFLGLRVQTDYRTGVTNLIPKDGHIQEGFALFIDEASYIDRKLMELIFSRTKNCKIIFIGDPAQLTPVKSVGAPVFESNFGGAALTEVVRQAKGNPIVDLSTKFRETVNTGKFFKFVPDGHHIQFLDRDAFNKHIANEFIRPGWHYSDSKILAWTNKCVIGFNNYVRDLAVGFTEFQEGDYAVNNSFLQIGRSSVKNDQMVQITNISEESERYGVLGRTYQMDGVISAFMPNLLADKNLAIKRARAKNDIHTVREMEEEWVDLRAAYACTINKAQGSTFGSVYIDLDDISRCNSGDQIARMLYVAVSRAKHHVFLTGDLC